MLRRTASLVQVVVLNFALFALMPPAVQGSTVVTQWEGLAQGGTVPEPDTQGAVGPSGVLATVQRRIIYYDKSGNVVWPAVFLSQFWTNHVSPNFPTVSDLQITYDPGCGRFFAAGHFNTGCSGYIALAVTKNSDPQSGGTNDWYFFLLNQTEVAGGESHGSDYESIGVDSQAVYITGNMFGLHCPSSGSFKNTQIIILDKASLITGTLNLRTVYTPDGLDTAFNLRAPSLRGTGSPGNLAYFAETPWNSNTAVRVWAVVDPLGAATLTNAVITVPNNGGRAGNAPQSGTTTNLDTLSGYTFGNATWLNGNLWFCHTAGGASRSIVYYYKINLNNFPTNSPTLAESGSFDGGAGVWTYQPTIGANDHGDLFFVYTLSSASSFPTFIAAGRTAGADFFETPVAIKTSPNYLNATLTGGGYGRWGDYAVVSPNQGDNTFFICNEFAKTTAKDNWSTWWAHVEITNTPPTITSIANQTVNEDTPTAALAFTVGDAENYSTNLAFAGFSSDTAIVPNGNIVFGGSGANRTVTITPGLNQFGTVTITNTVTDGDGASASSTFTLTINFVNHAPSFTKGADQTVAQNAGAQTVNGWATAISPGPANESTEILNFIVSNNFNALFSAPPAIAANGTLTFTPATNLRGTAVVTVQLHDDGGTGYGGSDTSAAQTFNITIGLATDTDGDLMPDDWESAYGLNPNSSADAALDTDGDGFTNLQEFNAGTNPNDPASRPAITSTALTGNDTVINFNTVPGKTYQVDYNDTFPGGSWTTFTNNISGTGGSIQVTNLNAGTQSQRIYRVQVQ
ncbi:MAG: hypothetical protein HY043_23920 [Verrucomicrobia bacterium]|nr:hypothetical protein [Verrucomicrobiota bacterium]